ncbi:hypothetical protein [Cetobacterium sp.]|uniref:hypothetical protein n=1 Tax=Cetobacterium sp. TaxID=2071632 RepID=UPI003F67CC51
MLLIVEKDNHTCYMMNHRNNHSRFKTFFKAINQFLPGVVDIRTGCKVEDKPLLG